MPTSTPPGPVKRAPGTIINKRKEWRGLATRYDKTATIYLAAKGTV